MTGETRTLCLVRIAFEIIEKTEGLLQAARLLGVMDSDEVNQLIDNEHINVFGETVHQRKERKKSLAELKEVSPDDYFSIPAIERR